MRTTQGWYPVLRPGQGRVIGRVYRAGVGFGEQHLRLLDAYEAFDRRQPERSEYRRRRVRVRILNGGWVFAQAYCHNRSVHAGMPKVPGGDFARFLRRRRLRSYGTLQAGAKHPVMEQPHRA